MIDPSSSEEESEDQGIHRGGGGGGRGGNASSHGSRHHVSGGGPGPGPGIASNTSSASSGLNASPGGPSHASPSVHAGAHGGATLGRSGGQMLATQQDAATVGLDVPSISSARSSLSPSMSAAQDAVNYAKSAQRPTSPSPSVASEKTEAELQVRFVTYIHEVINMIQITKYVAFSVKCPRAEMTHVRSGKKLRIRKVLLDSKLY